MTTKRSPYSHIMQSIPVVNSIPSDSILVLATIYYQLYGFKHLQDQYSYHLPPLSLDHPHPIFLEIPAEKCKDPLSVTDRKKIFKFHQLMQNQFLKISPFVALTTTSTIIFCCVCLHILPSADFLHPPPPFNHRQVLHPL